MALTKEMRQRIVQHQIHSMAIIDRNFPDIDSKLALVDRVNAHLSGKAIMPPDIVEAWLKFLMVFVYQDILDSADACDSTD